MTICCSAAVLEVSQILRSTGSRRPSVARPIYDPCQRVENSSIDLGVSTDHFQSQNKCTGSLAEKREQAVIPELAGIAAGPRRYILLYGPLYPLHGATTRPRDRSIDSKCSSDKCTAVPTLIYFAYAYYILPKICRLHQSCVRANFPGPLQLPPDPRFHQLQLPRASLQRHQRFGLLQHSQCSDAGSLGIASRSYKPDSCCHLEEPDQSILDGQCE